MVTRGARSGFHEVPVKTEEMAVVRREAPTSGGSPPFLRRLPLPKVKVEDEKGFFFQDFFFYLSLNILK